MTEIETSRLIPAGATDVAARAKASSQELWERAAVLTVSNDAEFRAGGALFREIADRRRELDITRLGITRPMDEAKKRVMELFAPVLAQIGEAEAAVKSELTTYEEQVEREARRQAAEAEEAMRKAREAAEEEAAALAAMGRPEEAEAVRYEAATAPSPEVPTATMPPRATGVVSGTSWSAEVTDKAALIKFVAGGGGALDWLDVNMPRLNAEARSRREAMNVPGARAVRKKTLSGR